MADTDIRSTTRTDMDSNVSDYSVDLKQLDSPSDIEHNYWDSPNWTKYHGYYKTIPELKKAVDALACWTAGKGWTTDFRTQVILEGVTGWGEDSFDSILQNMIIIKKINGDSFAEIIRNPDTGALVNIKPLNPGDTRIEVNRKGIITAYYQMNKQKNGTRALGIKFDPSQILHLSNDRIANEIHGVSVVEACQWVIDARNEAMSDWRKIIHRNLAGVRIIEVDEDDVSKLNTLKEQWERAIDKGEVLILPKGTAQLQGNPPTNPENWIRYLENFFYQAVGVPKIILGGSQDFTEASSKVGYLTFEQVYMAEQRLLEQDLFNQLGIKIKFDRPVSLKESTQSDEAANTGQVGFQPNELKPQVNRNE